MSVIISLQTKWQSISICFVLSWKIGFRITFRVICNVDWLS